MDRIEELLKQYREEMMETVQKWVSIPSVKGEAAPGAPFGEEARRALDTAMKDCERFGLKTEIFDGYAGHADLGEGNTRDALAILAHLDVVPVGDGWTYEPFGAKRENGRIYGRGASDDKGPAAAALYAMRAVREAGVPLRRKVRLILGCDEECGSSDIAYYKKVCEMPRSGFSPDADYPVINIEKGGVHLQFDGEMSPDGLQILSMQVGERANVIPGFASALVEGDEETAKKAEEAGKQFGFPVNTTLCNGAVIIETTGVTGHAAYPSQGKNAIGQMLLIFKALGAQGAALELADTVGMTFNGENLGIAMRDDISGELTGSLDIIRIENGHLTAVMDIRYPVLFNPDTMFALLRQRLRFLKVSDAGSRPPHFVSDQSDLVQELLEAYHEVTGGEKRTIAIGGGTYAQSLEEGVAFGAQFPGNPDLAHQADEYISEEDLFQNARIIAHAIVRLAGKEKEE
ncbi:MAG: Sapep family Mn(2+)-dependent dipeptidase [Clostridia bacterium]|nr:Sapep family Mn(2+)-dependent dipeptidase [Clostridia bacterium]